MIGAVLSDHYEIVDKIGQGGFAAVYRARDTKLKRDVAIKILTTTDTDRDFRGRFRRECEWMAGFKHPNIVTVFDVDEVNGAPYLVMELVDGLPLIELASSSTLAVQEVRQLGLQVCQAMAYSHAKGIVHRDLTLKNIMVEIDDQETPIVKILDFGLAKYLHDDVTMAVATMGTAPYLSPEQINGAAVDGRADIFAFGVGLYRMLAGRFPFEAEHPTATMYQICHQKEVEYPERIPPPLRDLIGRCLAKKPQDRPRGFASLVTEFQQMEIDAKPNGSVSLSARHRSATVTPQVAGTNPYLNRVMIRSPEEFFGRRREIRRIYSTLDASTPQCSSIVGERRIGKSSLLNTIYNRRNRERHMTNAADSIFVYLDFQGRDEFDVPRFIEFLFSVFRFEVKDIPEPKDGRYDGDLLRRTTRRLHQDGKRIIVLMDEFERITNNPNFSEKFFANMRSLANNYHVAYVTSSCGEMQNMCHHQEISDSPFFNIFSNLPLRPFSRAEALELIAEPSQAVGIPLADHADGILALAGLFPIYLQIACSCVTETLMDQPDEPVDWTDVTRRFLDEARPHFEFFWDQMTEVERENLLRVAVGKAVDRRAEHVNEELARRGYLVLDGGKPRLFAESFATFLAGKNRDQNGGSSFFSRFRRRS